MFNNKKRGRLTQTTLGLLILAIASIIVIFPLMLQSGEVADKLVTDETCRRSIDLRAVTKTDIVVEEVSTPLLCMTTHIELPFEDDTPEDFLRDFSTVICNIFDTFYRENVDETFLWRGYFGKDDKTKCFKYNTMSIKELKDTEIITTAELYRYMRENLYFVQEEDDNCKFEGGFCAVDYKTFMNEKEDKYKEDIIRFQEDERNDKCLDINREEGSCFYSKYECLNKGGECKDSEFESEEYKKYDKWNCPGKDVCFVKTENYITFIDFIQSKGGYVEIQEDLDFTSDKEYDLAYATKMDVDWRSTFDRMFKGGEPPRVVIARLGKLDEYCIVQKDVKGR